MRTGLRRTSWIAASGAGALALVALGYATMTWIRFGRPRNDGSGDVMLDRFMPRYDVVERHDVRVAAPAAATWSAARVMDLERSRLVRAIFRGRELLMGSEHAPEPPPAGPLLEQVLELGWGVLAEEPGREIVVGAVTQPWKADVRFRSLPPAEFAAFDEPGYVKIAWTLAVDSLGPTSSTFRTETRAVATDPESRRRFRRYWVMVSPGISLIRRESLRQVKAEAEAPRR